MSVKGLVCCSAVHPPILPVSQSGVKVECVRVGLWASSVERRTEIDTFVTVYIQSGSYIIGVMQKSQLTLENTTPYEKTNCVSRKT